VRSCAADQPEPYQPATEIERRPSDAAPSGDPVVTVMAGRVAVIGTGVIGACIGYYLTQAGVDAILVDAGRPGELTTGASFAWVNASSKVGNADYFALNFAGLREYERFVAEFDTTTWWNPTGHIRWDYHNERELADHVQQLRAQGYPAEVWEARQVQELLEPDVAFPSPTTQVARFPSEAWVDGPAMVEAVVASAVRKGATTAFGSAVRTIILSNRTVTAIELTSGETHQVELIVNAAGTAAPSVAALVGRRLQLKVRPGLAVRVNMSRQAIGRVIHAPEIAIRPDSGRRAFLLARGVEPRLREAGPPIRGLAENVKHAAIRVVPELADASVADVRVGQRPIPVDGLPLIGKVAGIGGYFEAVMHSGITLGPVVGRILAAEIVHGRIDPLSLRFRASRVRG
jgi:glycine/D-amino acid oxidase-like deaminating enzyme